jgi:hypothetical protein
MDDHALLARIAKANEDLVEVGETVVLATKALQSALQLVNERLDSIGDTLEIIAPLSNPDVIETEFNLSPVGRCLEEIARLASRIGVNVLHIEQHVAKLPHDY